MILVLHVDLVSIAWLNHTTDLACCTFSNERMTTHMYSLPGNLLLYGFRVGLGKQIQQHTAEVMCVTVGVTQLIGDGIQEQVTT